MFDVKKIRKDFAMLDNLKMQNHDLIYFDNSATSLKPKCVIEAINEYYNSYCANAHRGDYDIAHKVDENYENARKIIAKFINADEKEIVYTSGATMSLNMISYGLIDFINEGDEIIISEEEHASNVLPWFNLARIKKAIIKYVPLDDEGRILPINLKKVISSKTKIVALTHVSNVLGFVNDAKSLAKVAHENNAIFVLDGAQSVPHMKIDVKDLDVDFLAFSGHKMLAPTGIGVLYGKYNLLKKMHPVFQGGGMNTTFTTSCEVNFQEVPEKFEAGTPNIEGVIGLAKAIEYLNNIGMDNIQCYEEELKKYAIEKMEKLDNVIIYNKNSESGIIAFNIKGVFAQDAGSYFNSKGICVRTGLHCAKILNKFLNTDATIRASLYFYNTKEEIDAFVDACSTGGDFLDAFFA